MSRKHLKRLTRSMSAFAAFAAIASIAPSSAMATAPQYNATRPAQVGVSGGPSGAFTKQDSFSISLTTESSSLLKCREGLTARTNNAGWSNCQGAVLGNRTLTLSNLADGSYYWDIWALNAAYFQHLASISGDTLLATSFARQLDFTVDTIAPDAPSLTPQVADDTSTNATSQSIAFSGEQHATFECSVDGGSYEPCTSPLALSSLADGSHRVRITQTDRATNVSLDAYVDWTVDTIVPNAPQLSGAPSGSTKSTDANIAFTGEADATFTCSVDGGAYVPCTSPQNLSGLGDGPHSLSVKATDAAGNTSDAGSASWTVDTVAPDAPSSLVVPTSVTNSRSTVTSFSAEAGASLTCSVDDGAYVPCISPYAINDLADGTHTLKVKATDEAGNTSEAASASWTVDTVAPAKPVLGDGNKGTTNFSYQAFGITPSEDGGELQCKLGDGPWEPCFDRTHYYAENIPDGHYVVRVQHVDAAGNVSETATTEDWVIDTVAPDAPTITGAPFIYSTSHSNSISFSGEAGATFECSVDSGAWAPCSSPLELNNVADGNHSVNVRATDSASNVSAQASTSLIVDTVGAVVVVTGAPTGISSSGDASITLSSENGATFECKIDSGAWATCSSPVALNGLAEGAHSISVRATDSYGNTGAVVKKSWTVRKPYFAVDFTKPTTVSKGRKGTPWVLSLGVTTHNGDTRGGAYALTVQVSSSMEKPSDSQAYPTRPSYAEGILTYAETMQRRALKKQPRWIRVGTKVGKWTTWQAVTLSRGGLTVG